MSFDRSKTLAELGGDMGWDRVSDGEYDALKDKPLDAFTPEDLYALIGGDVALQYLVPLALEMLASSPLTECAHEPGGLLWNVLVCGGEHPYLDFWGNHPDLEARLVEILKGLDPIPDDLAEDAGLFLRETPRDRSRRLVRDAERLARLLPKFPKRRSPVQCDNGEPASVVFGRALEGFSLAVQEDPTNSDAYLQRGLVLYFQRKEEEAREDIRHALALGVEDPQKYTTLAMPLRGEEARAALRQGIALCETYPWDDPPLEQVVRHQLQCDIGQTYWRERDFRGCAEFYSAHVDWLEGLESLELVDEGRRHDFRASGIHTCCGFLSMCYEQLGDLVEAERAVRRSLPYLDRLPWITDEPQLRAEDIIRLRCEAGDFAGALAACDEFQAVLVAEDRAPWEALLEAIRAAAASLAEAGERKRACERLLEAVVRARVHQ